MKTEIVVTSDDQQHGDYKKGDFGYIDGYIYHDHSGPLAMVVIQKGKNEDTVVMIPTTCFKIRKYKK